MSSMQTFALRARQQWQSATWAEVGWLILCSVLFWASKWAGHLFEGVPGHAGAFWIPTLFLARAFVSRPGAATMTALTGASFWCFPRGGGSFDLASYVAAGIVLDALDLNTERLRRLPFALLGGGLCHLAKFGFHNVLIVLLGLPGPFLSWGLMSVAQLHLLFGLLGGFLGWVLLRAAQKTVKRPEM
jgi:hypothetical protein